LILVKLACRLVGARAGFTKSFGFGHRFAEPFQSLIGERRPRRRDWRLIFRRLLRVARLGLIRFNPPDRIFESEPLAGDLRLVERRLNAAQLRNQGAAGALVKQPAILAGIALKTANGAIDQRIIVSQFMSRVCSS
jgi:hypothetical protein